jgi:hypothetical protein
MAGAGGLVIGIEQMAPKGIEAGPPLKVGRQDKTIKKPKATKKKEVKQTTSLF